MHKIFFHCILSLCFVSCAVIPAKFQRVEGEFNGIYHAIENGKTDIRILVVHGIGWQERDYADKFIKGIVNLSRADFREILHERIEFGPNKGSVDISQYTDETHFITFYAVYWSDVSIDIKTWLEVNHLDTFGKRTVMNNQLKRTVLNNNFSDFVLYTSSSFGNEMRKPIDTALYMMYGALTVVNKGDTMYTLNIPPKNDYTEMIAVSGSLGTRMVFDALSNIKAQMNQQNINASDSTIKFIPGGLKAERKRHSAKNEKSKEIFFPDSSKNLNINMFFSMSNQIPLLALRDTADTFMNTQKNKKNTSAYQKYYMANYAPICRYLQDDTSTVKYDSLTLVGFYDPNDLLGYKLIDFKDKQYTCNGSLEIVNCVVNNAIPILGVFADPNKAHVGGWTNKKVIKLILYGNH